MKIKKNGKVVNLTETDIKRIVKRVLTEELFKSLVGWMKDEYPFYQRIFRNFGELVNRGYFS